MFGGGEPLGAAQNAKDAGLTLMLLFWAKAESKVPNATNSTKAIKAMDLKGVFTDSSSDSGSHDLEFSNLDAMT